MNVRLHRKQKTQLQQIKLPHVFKYNHKLILMYTLHFDDLYIMRFRFIM